MPTRRSLPAAKMALVLALVAAPLALAGPVDRAARPAGSSAVETVPELPEQPALFTGELGKILTPAPLDRAPLTYWMNGPCTVTVTCACAPSVSCSSDAGSGCEWQYDYTPRYPGYVKCGTYTASCELC